MSGCGSKEVTPAPLILTLLFIAEVSINLLCLNNMMTQPRTGVIHVTELFQKHDLQLNLCAAVTVLTLAVGFWLNILFL